MANPVWRPKPRVLWSQQGEYARSILGQYNAHHAHSPKLSYRFQGPHFVTWERGEFFLKPFGAYARHRYSFHVTPYFHPGESEPWWTFSVL